MNKQEFLAFSLPYGLKVTVTGKSNVSGEHIYTLYSAYSDTPVIEVVGESDFKTDKYKSICHPLSDLTKEIEHNGEKFIPIVALTEIAFGENRNYALFKNYCRFGSGDSFNYSLHYDADRQSFDCREGYDDKTWNYNCFVPNQLQLFQKLIEWHFDIARIIEKGEAIDVNTLSENPYK